MITKNSSCRMERSKAQSEPESSRQGDNARISGLLHDRVSQALIAAGLKLDLIRMEFENSAPEICSRITMVQKILDEAMTGIRELSLEFATRQRTQSRGAEAARNALQRRSD